MSRVLAFAVCLLAASMAWRSDAKPSLAGAPPPPAYNAEHRAPPPLVVPAQDAPGVMRVELSGSGPAARTVALGKGKSAIVELPVDARDITVGDPKVADVVLRTPRRISVLGIAPGQTDAVFFDGIGKPILRLDIRVDQDGAAVAQTIARVMPTSRITVVPVNESLILTGEAASASDADKAQQIAAQFVDKPEKVVNMISIAGKNQVMLKVRIVEVQRTSIKQLGFNIGAVFGQMGGNQWAQAFAPTYGINGALLGGFIGGYQRDTTQQPELQVPCSPGSSQMCPIVAKSPADAANWNAATLKDTAGSDGWNKANSTLQAFERAGLVRTLAEPNLTSVSGEPAKFLVGGEFPVPVGTDSQGRISVEFKQFGIGLGFTPIVLSDGRISLKLSTEVSELTNVGGFSISTAGTGSSGSSSSGTAQQTASNLSIPGLNVRRAETTVELPSGGALMIAGLLQDETKQNLDSLPGLMNLPILGTLFRSRDYQNGETELAIIVTPYLVKATSPDQLQTPADGLQLADDAQTILLGRLNKVYKAQPSATAGHTYQGPYGYVIE
jgi:pilus assembly protein CpaC